MICLLLAPDGDLPGLGGEDLPGDGDVAHPLADVADLALLGGERYRALRHVQGHVGRGFDPPAVAEVDLDPVVPELAVAVPEVVDGALLQHDAAGLPERERRGGRLVPEDPRDDGLVQALHGDVLVLDVDHLRQDVDVLLRPGQIRDLLDDRGRGDEGRAVGPAVLPDDPALGGLDVHVVIVEVLVQLGDELFFVDLVSEHPFHFFDMGC